MVSELLRVEVVYALPMRQMVLPVSVTPGSTVEEAIAQSGMLRRFPEISDRPLAIGIFSRPVAMQTVLQGGERIEIYRPLIADPRAMRQQRADRAKMEGRSHPVTGGRR